MYPELEVTVGSHGVLPLLTHPSVNAELVSTVSVVETLKVPAISEIEVICRIDASTKDATWLVEGNEKASVLIAHAAVRPSNNLIPLRLINTSLVPITLYKGARIAKAEEINDTNICTVMNPSKEPNMTEVDLAHSLPESLTQLEQEKFLALYPTTGIS